MRDMSETNSSGETERSSDRSHKKKKKHRRHSSKLEHSSSCDVTLEEDLGRENADNHDSEMDNQRHADEQNKKDKKRKRDKESSTQKEIAQDVDSNRKSHGDEKKKKKKDKKHKSSKDRRFKDESEGSDMKRRKKNHEADNTDGHSRGIDGTHANNERIQKYFPLEYEHILAPMVGASELAFRLLCRKYGATLAYTPMMSASQFVEEAAVWKSSAAPTATIGNASICEFQTIPEDRPLVCHFSANDPQNFAKAASLVEPFCDAIDLNLGCPQRTAYVGHFGSYLLGEEDRYDASILCR